LTTSGHYTSEDSQGRQAFYQRRVATFGLVASGIFLALLALRTGWAVAAGEQQHYTHPDFLFHVVGIAFFTGLWLVCRGRRLPYRVVRAIETTGVIGGSVSIAVMAVYLPLEYSPHLMVTLALTQGLVARAVFVPSTPRRTVGLGLVVGAALVGCVYWTSRAEDWSALSRAAVTTVVWGLTVAICAAASKVIFGLRREVAEALQLGQYTLEEKLGEGAMGMVFRAHHGMLRRPTAIKLLLPDKVGERHLVRFEREVQLTAKLTHPNTVTIYDYGRTPDGIFYYAMELLEGAPLDKIVEVDGAQPPERVAYLMDQIAAALAEAHKIGLIHRDIKPANIILTQQGGEPDVAKVVDFGLVKDVRDDSSPDLSRTEGIAGTPLYMSPETITAFQNVDARSDIYSLGAVAYFLLTGRHVFEAETAAEICTKHLYEEAMPPSQRINTPMPADLESVILACLQKDPSMRPQSASHIRARIWAGGTVTKWNTDRARRWWRAKGEAAKAATRRKAEPLEAGMRTIMIDLAKMRS